MRIQSKLIAIGLLLYSAFAFGQNDPTVLTIDRIYNSKEFSHFFSRRTYIIREFVTRALNPIPAIYFHRYLGLLKNTRLFCQLPDFEFCLGFRDEYLLFYN